LSVYFPSHSFNLLILPFFRFFLFLSLPSHRIPF
jgi:hypothetical protein